MAETTFDKLVEKVNELTIAEQRRLYTILDRKLTPSAPPASDRRVPLILSDVDFSQELGWLNENREEYAGQWVALKGDRLIAAGTSASQVFAAADAAGVDHPLVTRVDDLIPFAGV